MDIQLGAVPAAQRQRRATFHCASVVSAVLGAGRLDQQHAALLAESAGRDAQLGHRDVTAQPVERPRDVQRRVAFGHQARHLRSLPGEYRLFEGERSDSRGYCVKRTRLPSESEIFWYCADCAGSQSKKGRGVAQNVRFRGRIVEYSGTAQDARIYK